MGSRLGARRGAGDGVEAWGDGIYGCSKSEECERLQNIVGDLQIGIWGTELK